MGSNPKVLVSLWEETPQISLPLSKCAQRRGHVRTQEGGPLQARKRALTKNQARLIYIDYDYTRFSPFKSVFIIP